LFLSGVGAGGIDRRPIAGFGKTLLGTGLPHACFGDAQVEVGRHGPSDEGIQLGVMELFPPRADEVVMVGDAAGERFTPLRRQLDVRPLIVWADGASAGQQHERSGDKEFRIHRGFFER